MLCLTFHVLKNKTKNKAASVGGTNIRLGCCRKTASGFYPGGMRALLDITVS